VNASASSTSARRPTGFATKNAREAEPDEPAGRKAELQRRFSEWHEPITAVLNATDESAILRNDVYYLEHLPRWTNGRIVLLGDAAHATTPGVGQGAAQAIEDAVVLAAQLAHENDLADALGRYESIRKPRAESVQKISRRADKAAQLAVGCINSISSCGGFVFVDESAEQVLSSDRCR